MRPFPSPGTGDWRSESARSWAMPHGAWGPPQRRTRMEGALSLTHQDGRRGVFGTRKSRNNHLKAEKDERFQIKDKAWANWPINQSINPSIDTVQINQSIGKINQSINPTIQCPGSQRTQKWSIIWIREARHRSRTFQQEYCGECNAKFGQSHVSETLGADGGGLGGARVVHHHLLRVTQTICSQMQSL